MSIAESLDLRTQILFLAILYLMLIIDYCVDYCNRSHHDGNIEGFDSFKNRAERIKDLNDSRGTTGNFYVECHGCGRDRILEDRKKTCNSCTNENYCSVACKERENTSMSFFNKNYVDTDQIFCYNCLLDNDHNDRYFLKNYVYWPDTNDPVNGPPYY